MHISAAVARRFCRATLGFLTVLVLSFSLVAPAPARTADPDPHGEQWWVSLMGLEDAWKLTQGEGVVVAVIDAGVDPSGDLEGAVLPGFSLPGGGRGDTDPDADLHGTRMATLIAGRGTGLGMVGVAPKAKILPVRVPEGEFISYLPKALKRLAAMPNPPEIVNLSFVTPTECSSEIQEAVRIAIDAGMILVAGMGNQHSSSGKDYVLTPASCAGVIAVGAYGFYGNTADGPDLRIWEEPGAGSERQSYAGLAGPGMDIPGPKRGSSEVYITNGTSDATAILAGGFALLRSNFPAMSSREIVARAIHTARQFQGKQGSRNDAWGFGAMRPLNAIEENVPANAPNPIYDALDKVAPPADDPSANPSAGGGDEPDAAEAQGSDADEDSGLSASILVGLGVVALALIALVVAMARRRGRSA